MKTMHLTPQLAANLKSCETSIRCLDTIKHEDLDALRDELRERLVSTAEELSAYFAKNPEPEIDTVRSLTLTYVELEAFAGMSIDNILKHVHHLMHIKDADDYCLKVGQRIAGNAHKLREALDMFDNPRPSIAKLLELLTK